MMNKKRWLFVLGHAATAVVVSLILIYTNKFFGPFIAAVVGATLCLIFKEFGEIVGKKKAAGTFENNFNGNKEAFIDAIDDKWQLMQTVGAAAIGVIFIVLFKAFL
jgi:hypothetical protein